MPRLLIKTTKDINRWIDRRTDGMIKDIMDQIPPYAIMYLVNAVAFEGEWKDPYEKEQVHDADFMILMVIIQQYQ